MINVKEKKPFCLLSQFETVYLWMYVSRVCIGDGLGTKGGDESELPELRDKELEGLSFEMWSPWRPLLEPSTCHCVSGYKRTRETKRAFSLMASAEPLLGLWDPSFHLTWASSGHKQVLLREQMFWDKVTWMSPSCNGFRCGTTWISYSELP